MTRNVTISDDRPRGLLGPFLWHRYFRNSIFHYAILLPFVLSIGGDPATFAFIDVCYWLTLGLAQLPSGYLADKYGHKRVATIGVLLVVAGFVVLATAGSVGPVFGAVVLVGLGQAFWSGPDSALIANALEAQGKRDFYARYEFLGWGARHAALAVSMVAGSVTLLWLSFPALILASATCAAISLIGLSRLPEPFSQVRRSLTVRNAFDALASINRRRLSLLMATYCLFVTVDYLANWTLQLALLEAGFGAQWFGPIYCLALVTATACVAIGSHVQALSRSANTAIFTSFGAAYLVGCLLLASQSTAEVLIVIITAVCSGALRGLAVPLMRTWITDLFPGQVRSSAISVATLMGSFSVAGVSAAAGGILTIAPANVLFALLAVGTLLLGGIVSCIWRRMEYVSHDA